MNIIAIGYSRL